MGKVVSGLKRRDFLKQSAAATTAVAFPYLWIPKTGSASTGKWPSIDSSKPIKIGILFSLSGAEKVYSHDIYKIALMAVEDINKAGGIHGARLEPVVRDPGSHWPNYTRYAKELSGLNVNIIWGCIVSASREAALPAIKQEGGLLYYGMLYEGRGCSHNMIATGSCPNQQTEVSIPWIMKRTGPKTYILGSNYIFPHTMSKQARITLRRHGGKVLGDEFFTFGIADSAPFESVVKDIEKKKPDWILSNLVADNIGGFLKAFRDAGLTPDRIPILHTGMFEASVAAIGPELCAGHYSTATYFQTIDTPSNREFVKRFQFFVGSRPEWRNETGVLTTLAQGVYTGALACKEAMIKANSAHPGAVREASRGLVLKAPEGYDVKIDSENLHAWLRPHIGKVNDRGLFDIVYESPVWVRPEVFNPEMDPHRKCRDGGQFFIKGVKVPGPKVTRRIVPQ